MLFLFCLSSLSAPKKSDVPDCVSDPCSSLHVLLRYLSFVYLYIVLKSLLPPAFISSNSIMFFKTDLYVCSFVVQSGSRSRMFHY